MVQEPAQEGARIDMQSYRSPAIRVVLTLLLVVVGSCTASPPDQPSAIRPTGDRLAGERITLEQWAVDQTAVGVETDLTTLTRDVARARSDALPVPGIIDIEREALGTTRAAERKALEEAAAGGEGCEQEAARVQASDGDVQTFASDVQFDVARELDDIGRIHTDVAELTQDLLSHESAQAHLRSNLASESSIADFVNRSSASAVQVAEHVWRQVAGYSDEATRMADTANAFASTATAACAPPTA